MKNNMNLVLNNHPNQSTFVTIMEFINELIDCMKVGKKAKVLNKTSLKSREGSTSSSIIPESLVSCYNLRRDRKAFEIIIRDFLKNDFHTLPEKQQADVEMHFFRAIKKLNKVSTQLKKDDSHSVISFNKYFAKRELNKALKIFKTSQQKMADVLYPDNSQEILSNPVEYQKLVDFWGDLAD